MSIERRNTLSRWQLTRVTRCPPRAAAPGARRARPRDFKCDESDRRGETCRRCWRRSAARQDRRERAALDVRRRARSSAILVGPLQLTAEGGAYRVDGELIVGRVLLEKIGVPTFVARPGGRDKGCNPGILRNCRLTLASGASLSVRRSERVPPGSAAQLQQLWRNPKASSTTIEIRCPAVSSHRSRWRTGCWEPRLPRLWEAGASTFRLMTADRSRRF